MFQTRKELKIFWKDVLLLSLETIDQEERIKLSNSVDHNRIEVLRGRVSPKFNDNPVFTEKPAKEENIERLSPAINEDHGARDKLLKDNIVDLAPLRRSVPTKGSLLRLLISTNSSVPSTKTSVILRL